MVGVERADVNLCVFKTIGMRGNKAIGKTENEKLVFSSSFQHNRME